MWWVSKILLLILILIGFQNIILAWNIKNLLKKYNNVDKYFVVGGLADIISLLRKHKKENILSKKDKNILYYTTISYLLLIIILNLLIWSMS